MEISAKDICEILQACKQTKIKRLEFGNLKLIFGSQKVKPETKVVAPQVEMPDLAVTDAVREALEEIRQADTLADLALSNPTRFEEELEALDKHEHGIKR